MRIFLGITIRLRKESLKIKGNVNLKIHFCITLWLTVEEPVYELTATHCSGYNLRNGLW